MKNKIKLALAVTMLTMIVASCTFFKSEKSVAEQKDTTPDSIHVSPADTLAPLEQAPDSVDGN